MLGSVKYPEERSHTYGACMRETLDHSRRVVSKHGFERDTVDHFIAFHVELRTLRRKLQPWSVFIRMDCDPPRVR